MCYSESDFPPDKIPGIYTCGSLKKRAVRGAPFYFWFKNHGICADMEVASERPYLFSFMGRNCTKVRSDILGMSFDDSVACYVEDTTKSYPVFNAVKNKDTTDLESQKRRYNELLSKSKFVLAPRGAGLSSFRQYEAMAFGCVPVVLSDDLRQPDSVDWSECSVKIAESDVSSLASVLKKLEPKYTDMSLVARESYKKLMDPVRYWSYIEASILSIYDKDMDERKPITSLHWAVMQRAVRRTLYRRKNDVKRIVNRFIR
jgi:hypothetical protein